MGTILNISSELMEHYKRFRVASAEKKMQAVCREGLKGFLSVGDDGVLYLSYEKTASAAGWVRIKLCEKLRKTLQGAVDVNTFSVASSRDTGKDYVLVALKADGKDRLFLSANGDLTSPQWTEIPLSSEMKSDLSIYDVTVSSYKSNLYLIVDFKKINQSTTRYFICSNGASYEKWDYFPLPADFTEIADAVPGRANKEFVDGIYTIGSNMGKRQLLYTPAYNYFEPSMLPPSARLVLPREADAISTLPTENGQYTHLFACGDGSLFLYPYDKQSDLANPVLIASSRLFSGIKKLFSYTSNGRVYIWALNESKNLVYLYGKMDQLQNPDSWSDVFLLKNDIDYVYPFRQGLAQGDNALFAYTKDGEGLLGEESGQTGLWSFTPVYVDQDATKPVLIHAYTTLVKVMDENMNSKPEQPVTIETAERCLVYINGGTYQFQGRPLTINSNEVGEVKIIQLADSAQAIQFDIRSADSEKQTVNPARDVMPKLFALDTPDKLKNAKIKSQSGQQVSLVPTGAKQQDLASVAKALETLDKAGVQTGGSKWKYSGSLTSPHSDFAGVHIHFGKDGTVSSGFPALQSWDICREQLAPDHNGQILYGSILTARDLDAIRNSNYSSEDVFGFFRSILDDVFDVIIGFFEDAWHFVVKIGEKVLSFIISCVEEVIACAVEVFQLIKVALGKIIEFLKFVFDMGDIIRSRDILEKLVTVSMNDMKTEIALWRKKADDTLDKFIHYIETWGEIGDIGDIGHKDVSQLKAESPYNEANDVRSSHFQDMVIENQQGPLQFLYDPIEKIPDEVQSSIDEIISFLKKQVEADKEVIDHLAARIEDAFAGESGITGMDVLTILKKLAAIIGSTSLEIIKVIIDAIFDLVLLLIDLVLKALTKELYIPCVSEFLELCGIGRFSLLDVICFVPAFMGTVMYKLIAQKQLIDDEVYQTVMKIKSLSDLPALQCMGQADVLPADEFSNYVMESDALFISESPPSSRKLYFTIKLFGGAAACCESILSAINYMKPGPAKGGMLTNVSLGCNLLSGACYIGSFFMYAPLYDKIELLQFSKLFSLAKCSSYIVKCLGILQKEEEEDWDLLFKTTFGLTSLIVAGADIVFLVEAAKQPAGLDKNVFIVDTVSLLVDNLRNFGDLLLVTVSAPIPHTIILVVRTICAAGYGIMQITEGGMVL